MCCTLKSIKYIIFLQVSFSGLSNWQVHSDESLHKILRRQNLDKEAAKAFTAPTGNVGPQADAAHEAANRFVTGPTSSKKRKRRTTPVYSSKHDYCDNILLDCMQAYQTGKLCARTVYFNYKSFDNYCEMEYVNCRESYELWQMVYGGECFDIPVVEQYEAFFNDGVNGVMITHVTQQWGSQLPKYTRLALRQDFEEQTFEVVTAKSVRPDVAQAQKGRTEKTMSTRRKRTLLEYDSAQDRCDYLALKCLRAYQTGRLCARTVFYTYMTFRNYCMFDFANCKLRYQSWIPLHMGDCFDLQPLKSFLVMSEESSKNMDRVYIIDKVLDD